MTAPDLIIFDCDGVLVDSEVLSCRVLSDALAAQGVAVDVGEIVDRFLGRSMNVVIDYCASVGRPAAPTFRADVAARLREAFQAGLQPIAGVSAVLRDLTVPSCVASSSDLDRVSLSLGLTGLAAHFGPRVFTAQMVQRGKPAPDLFLYAADKMGVRPDRTLVIEDSVSGVTAGKAAGMAVWGFVGGGHYHARDGRGLLEDAGADRVFSRMADFWRGDD